MLTAHHNAEAGKWATSFVYLSMKQLLQIKTKVNSDRLFEEVMSVDKAGFLLREYKDIATRLVRKAQVAD